MAETKKTTTTAKKTTAEKTTVKKTAAPKAKKTVTKERESSVRLKYKYLEWIKEFRENTKNKGDL